MEQTLEGHSGSVSSVAFSWDGSRLASGSDDRTVRVRNVAIGQVEQTLEGYSGSVYSVAYSCDDYSVDSSKEWVIQNGLRIQCLPFDLRPGKVAIKEGSLAIGAESGHVTSITFRSDINAGTI